MRHQERFGTLLAQVPFRCALRGTICDAGRSCMRWLLADANRFGAADIILRLSFGFFSRLDVRSDALALMHWKSPRFR